MKRLILITLLIAMLALGISCGAASVAQRAAQATAAPQPTTAPAMAEAYDTQGGTTNSGKAQPPAVLPAQPTEAPQPSSGDNAQAQGRMIVYTGSVTMQVDDTAATVTKIQELLNNVNGYIAFKSLVATGGDKLRGTINVRIPAAALNTTLGQIKALGVKVIKETADSNDVTAEYVDLEARRKNLEAYEVELQKLLETVRERTGKAEDILAVYNQLTQVRGEIEQIKGRQNYLENTSTLATYTIELVPVEQVIVQGDPGWNPGQTANQALDNLIETLQGLGDVAITFALFVLPVLLILLLPLIVFALIVRAFLKRRTSKKPVTAS